MRQIVFPIIIATLFVACNNSPEIDTEAVPAMAIQGTPEMQPEETPDLTQISIKDESGEKLEYVGLIGNDFDSALDSLRILKSITSDIIKEHLDVIFDYDDRLFYGIIYGDCAMYSDVLDTKGNYYLRS